MDDDEFIGDLWAYLKEMCEINSLVCSRCEMQADQILLLAKLIFEVKLYCGVI